MPAKSQPAVNRTLLIIIDGFGISPGKTNNAIYLADTPRLDRFFSDYPHTLLEASGPSVGLPPGQIGNSEVGHITMGCGCIVPQDLVRINTAIEDGSFFDNPSLIFMMKKAKGANRPIHLLGLVSDGGVHSHVNHLLALIRLAREQGCKPVVHVITDGRDTLPRCAHQFTDKVQGPLEQAGGTIATIMGRYYAMDRDNRWERTGKAWRALALNEGPRADSAADAIDAAYRAGIGDEFIEPTVLPQAQPMAGDNAILFNFRNDRPRQLVKALAIADFDTFDRGGAGLANIATMTEIDQAFPCLIAFSPIRPKATLAKIISDAGMKQFHCAETEKYPHVTFFFNGGIEQPLPGEDRALIDSPKVATYDLQPEMSARQVADATIHVLEKREHVFAVVNFANADMVGHTATPKPIIKAVETVDLQAGRLVDTALENGWTTLITADHGNCDEMLDTATKQPNTQHTTNPVPCLIIGKNEIPNHLASGCSISSIAPTVLDLMGLEIPEEMDAPSVIVH